MKNLQIGDNDNFGKRFNGHDLHLYLNEKGIESKHIVFDKYLKDDNTYSFRDYFNNSEILNEYARLLNKFYSSNSLFYPLNYGLLFDENFVKSDIIHYHLIHNSNFNILMLPILTRLKPSVWTLHDPWAFTGHCIHPFDCKKWKFGCGNCPDLKTEFTIEFDSTAINWEIKKIYYDNSEIDIIVSSKWMYNRICKSPLFENHEKHLIPFGINLNNFHPMDSNIEKERLGIPRDNIVIAFRSQPWKLKGLDYIKECLLKLNTNKKITLLTFSHKGLIEDLKDKYHIVELGWISCDNEMVRAYNAVDIFLMPSTAESFGMMAMEAMACAKPVIAFDGTALSDTLHAPTAGIIVSKYNSTQMAYELNKLIDDEKLRERIGKEALKIAKMEYDHNRYVNQIINLYKYVIKKKGKSKRKLFILNSLEEIIKSNNISDKIHSFIDYKHLNDNLICENSTLNKNYIELYQSSSDLQQKNSDLHKANQHLKEQNIILYNSKALIIARAIGQNKFFLKIINLIYIILKKINRIFLWIKI